MSGAKEIKSKIQSVQSTQKITNAMQMVAASKMRKAQDRMTASRPYAQNMYKVISHIAMGSLEYRHPYIDERDVKRVGYIVISTDRGLCGGLNVNLFKKVTADVAEWKEKGVDASFAVVGSKAAAFFHKFGGAVKAQVTGLSDDVALQDLIGTVKVMLEAYDKGEIDRLYIVANRFVNTMKQDPTILQLLPLPKAENEELQHLWDYIYEPDAKELLDALMDRYIESLVYQGVVENQASEQAARMVAMKAATDNADNLIDDLSLVYNKARQAGITQELTEIVSGAAAV